MRWLLAIPGLVLLTWSPDRRRLITLDNLLNIVVTWVRLEMLCATLC